MKENRDEPKNTVIMINNDKIGPCCRFGRHKVKCQIWLAQLHYHSRWLLSSSARFCVPYVFATRLYSNSSPANTPNFHEVSNTTTREDIKEASCREDVGRSRGGERSWRDGEGFCSATKTKQIKLTSR
jgi:hypothetical protein